MFYYSLSRENALLAPVEPDYEFTKVEWSEEKTILELLEIGTEAGNIYKFYVDNGVVKPTVLVYLWNQEKGSFMIVPSYLNKGFSGYAEVSKVQYDLQLRKKFLLNEFVKNSFDKRVEILPDYKISNATLGVYDDETKSSYLETVKAFRTEYYRLVAAVGEATTMADLDSIQENYPTALVVP